MDEISKAIGELKGQIETNHAVVQSRFDKLEGKVEGLQSLHWKIKGAMAVISFLVVAAFHAIVEGAKTYFR